MRVYLGEWDVLLHLYIRTVCVRVCMHVYDIPRVCFSAFTVDCLLRQCPNGASEEF